MKKYINAAFMIPLILTLSFFAYWVFSQYLNRDLVWDELVSLKNFVLVDYKTTLTSYPDVNNHIFFNFLNNIYCQLIGIENVYDAMDYIVIMRLFPLFFTLLTFLFIYRLCSKFLGIDVGFIALVLLITTLPFLNFTMQLRGYTMSMAFMAGSLYYLLSLEQKFRWKSALFALLFLFGLLYAIPSNAYFYLAFIILYLYKWFRDMPLQVENKSETISEFIRRITHNNTFYILVILAFALTLAFAAYLPILKDILNEHHLEDLKGQSHYLFNIQKTIPSVLFYILSYRFLLIIPLISSFMILVAETRKQKLSPKSYYLMYLLAIGLISFSISLVRGDKPPQRTFSPLNVAFAIGMAAAISQFTERFSFLRGRDLRVYFIVFCYCIASYFISDTIRQKKLSEAMSDGKMEYNMFYNFYQSDKFGREYLEVLIAEAQKTKYPIILAKNIDRVFEGTYLLKNDLDFYSTVWSRPGPAEHSDKEFEYYTMFEFSKGKEKDSKFIPIAYPPIIREEDGMFIPLYSYLIKFQVINKEDPKFYVLTFDPFWFEAMMTREYSGLKLKKLNSEMSYHNAYLITK